MLTGDSDGSWMAFAGTSEIAVKMVGTAVKIPGDRDSHVRVVVPVSLGGAEYKSTGAEPAPQHSAAGSTNAADRRAILGVDWNAWGGWYGPCARTVLVSGKILRRALFHYTEARGSEIRGSLLPAGQANGVDVI